MSKKFYETPDIDKGPHLTEQELAEIEEFAQRRNDDLIEKMLKDRLFWIRSCAHAELRLHFAIASGMTWLSKLEERRKAGWARANCWARAREEFYKTLPDALFEAPLKQPVGFDLSGARNVSATTRAETEDTTRNSAASKDIG